jgi:molybdate transport system substrate-binding protein
MPSKSIKSRQVATCILFPIVFLIVSKVIYATETVETKPLRLAVASNFVVASQQLASAFEQRHSIPIEISSGSSGKLYHQIMQGAPYDIFLSADQDKPRQLIANQRAHPSSLTTYAKGQLALWLKQCEQMTSLSILNQTKVTKIAIANPKLAPYGIAAQDLINQTNLWEILQPKLVFPENIAQVAQLAMLGVVDAAFIAKAHQPILAQNTTNHPKSCVVSLSGYHYPAIEQQLVIIKSSLNQQQAWLFVEFIKSHSAQALIKNMGYLVD